jgi:hypothetical protein
MKLRFALGIIYRAKSWTVCSVADAKRSATRNSSVASCYQPSSCLVDDNFYLGSVSSAVKCHGKGSCRCRHQCDITHGTDDARLMIGAPDWPYGLVNIKHIRSRSAQLHRGSPRRSGDRRVESVAARHGLPSSRPFPACPRSSESGNPGCPEAVVAELRCDAGRRRAPADRRMGVCLREQRAREQVVG